MIIGLDFNELVVHEPPPDQAVFIGQPDKIFQNTSTKIGALFLMEIIGGGAGRNLSNKLRRSADVSILIHMSLTVFPHQKQVWLGFIQHVETDGGIVRHDKPGVFCGVNLKQCCKSDVRYAVKIGSDWRCHIYDSFDEFRLFQAGHCGETALELRPSQHIPLLQKRRVV